MEMYDNPQHVQDTFTPEKLPEYLLQAQWAEFVALKQTIHELVQRKGAPISILDIGIGDARIPKHLSGIKELWDKISHYTGIDVSQNCIDLSKQIITNNHITNKITTT